MTYATISFMMIMTSLGLTVNFLVHYALLYIIRQPAPMSKLNEFQYASKYGMPAFASQYIVFLFGFLVLFTILYHQKPLSMFYMVFTYIFGVVCIFQRIHYHRNTPNQILVGGLVGIVVCVLYIALIDMVLVRYQTPIVAFCRTIFRVTDKRMVSKNVHERLPALSFVDDILVDKEQYVTHMAELLLYLMDEG
ncbi:MAG: hypothetical protein JSS82_00300 [Bacteroidetes bacterium]|nr:hypothetical protein [Bacteroidota bacterium]